jgi:hypothetical protein
MPNGASEKVDENPLTTAIQEVKLEGSAADLAPRIDCLKIRVMGMGKRRSE